ncbi:hypothetical protein Apa02nite_076740 [Actinoplanes palleronii]|uniref:Uncharacterized protein n=1 Tax=Actinoplanes palleronii TaxID=113570 RepID=A0ABQ4BLL5_9ACTN|nr:hypothetical protein Apa02nite_076740 [Actinoplanes palleronii]
MTIVTESAGACRAAPQTAEKMITRTAAGRPARRAARKFGPRVNRPTACTVVTCGNAGSPDTPYAEVHVY